MPPPYRHRTQAIAGSAECGIPAPVKDTSAMVELEALIRAELSGLGIENPDLEVLEAGPFTDEPVVASIDVDLFGIALSGGGIRSATFNLGLLQGLENRGLLESAHYLSSVSGGGYVAGFYSALKATEPPQTSTTKNEPDTPAVRHLREFSSFLVPRVGLFQAETHRALAHALRVMPVAIAGSLSLLVCAMCIWLWTVAACARWPITAPFVTGLLMVIGWCLTSIATGRFHPGRGASPGGREQLSWADPLVWHLVLTAVLFVAVWLGLEQEWSGSLVTTHQGSSGQLELPVKPEPDTLETIVSPAMYVVVPYLSPIAFLAVPYVVLLLQRAWFGLLAFLGQSPDDKSRLRRRIAADQSTALIAAAAILWVFCLVPWKLGVILAASGWEAPLALLAVLLALFDVSRRLAPAAGKQTRAASSLKLRLLRRLPAVLASAVLLGTASLVACGLVLLHWKCRLDQPFEMSALRPVAEALRDRMGVITVSLLSVLLLGLVVADKLRRRQWSTAALQCGLVAIIVNVAEATYVTAIVTLVLCTGILIGAAPDRALRQMLILLAVVGLSPLALPYLFTAPPLCLVFAMSGAVLAYFTVVFTPTRTSFFTFYRERIARAYLGARNSVGSGTDIHKSRATAELPDDDLELSKLKGKPLHLICVAANDLGNDRLSNLSRGASSAVLSKHGLAVGSRWHGVKKLGGLTLGEAITASGAAFNSNMGTASVNFGLASGILMTALNLRLGLWVRTDHECKEADGQGRRRRYWGGWLFFREMFQRTFATHGEHKSPTYHVSDGGHFENLGLYELLRRHCSYIVVSDATADPDLTFADVGNAIQLAREDFGIEIEIDFSALRPDENGLSKVRMAVGRIYYPSGKLGVLLYVKPVLVGDESEDIRQYWAESRTFPHEGTADQFYDRAQWECYRKLGALTVRHIFSYVDPDKKDEQSLEWVFQTAYSRWSPMPGGVYKRTIEANEDYSRLIAGLGTSSVAASTLLGRDLEKRRRGGKVQSPSVEDVVDCLSLLQTIEHIWASCRLDDYLFHRAASGWFDFIERVASGSEFRQLWPLLRWQFSREFGEFMERRFQYLDSKRPESSSAFKIVCEQSLIRNVAEIDAFAREHPRRQLKADQYTGGYQLWLRATGSDRIVPDTILAASPRPDTWTNVGLPGKEQFLLLDLCNLLVRPGTGGLQTAASFLSKLKSLDGGVQVNDKDVQWALCIRGTPDQQSATPVSERSLLLTRGGRETPTISVIHRRAIPFIEARLGSLSLCRLRNNEELLPNKIKNRTEGELVGLIRPSPNGT